MKIIQRHVPKRRKCIPISIRWVSHVWDWRQVSYIKAVVDLGAKLKLLVLPCLWGYLPTTEMCHNTLLLWMQAHISHEPKNTAGYEVWQLRGICPNTRAGAFKRGAVWIFWGLLHLKPLQLKSTTTHLPEHYRSKSGNRNRINRNRSNLSHLWKEHLIVFLVCPSSSRFFL